MSAPGLRWPDARLIGLAGAFLLALVAASSPRAKAERQVYDVVAFVDITVSMNARDYLKDGLPQSRLDTVKEQLVAAAGRLPCGSRFGLGVFTERRVFLLFEPFDVCASFTAFSGAVSALTWRMAWDGDSRVASGVFRAIDLVRPMNAGVLFLTDGHEAPPLRPDQELVFEGKPGEVRGVLVGVGGDQLAPIPRYDDFGRENGFFSMADVPQANRIGMTPEGAEARAGYNARNAPFGDMPPGEEHLTSVREQHLRDLGRLTGLGYARLGSPRSLADAIEANASPRPASTAIDLAPIPAAAALLALAAIYGAPLTARLRRRRSSLP